MKKTVSFSLEEETIEFLDELKEVFNVATRSSALEKFIGESRAKKVGVSKDEIRDLIKEVLGEMNLKDAIFEEVETKTEIIQDNITDSIADSMEDMPD